MGRSYQAGAAPGSANKVPDVPTATVLRAIRDEAERVVCVLKPTRESAAGRVRLTAPGYGPVTTRQTYMNMLLVVLKAVRSAISVVIIIIELTR